jgi:hypothetical protein
VRRVAEELPAWSAEHAQAGRCRASGTRWPAKIPTPCTPTPFRTVHASETYIFSARRTARPLSPCKL